MHKVRVAATAAVLLVGGASVALANMITVGGGATGTGPYTLVSNSTIPDSYVDVTLSTPTAFNSITSLDAVFNDISGGADGGSPRIVLSATDGDFFDAYLGTPPDFNDSNPAAFTSAFSGVNLDNGTDNSAFKNGPPYQTLASLQTTTTPPYDTDLIDDVTFVVDGGWATNGAQDLTLSALDLNGVNLLAPSAVPEPTSLAILGAGMIGLAGFGRVKRNGGGMRAKLISSIRFLRGAVGLGHAA